jgi:orotate phosphoribosyltransferase
MNKIVERLLERALELEALKYGDFTLSSGKKSSYYFDGRRLTLDAEGSWLVGQAVFGLLKGTGVEAIGGLTLGADPMVASVALTSYREGQPVSGFIVRKEAKSHGTKQGIEGPLRQGSRVAIVDDVCTTGGSIFQAISAAEGYGCKVEMVAAILDRREGGSEELTRRGYKFTSLLAATAEGKVRVVL